MAKLNVAKIQLSCSVKGCTNVENGMFLDRHHIRSQKLFVKHFEHRKSRRYLDFAKRYYAFRAEDICRLCREHHEEVHETYWDVLRKHTRKLMLPLRSFSWRQANILMDDFEIHFYRWLERRSKQKVSGTRALLKAVQRKRKKK